MSGRCVILSTVLPNLDPNVNRNRGVINDRYRALVAELSRAGKCIYLADMEAAPGWIDPSVDMADGTHPNVSISTNLLPELRTDS